MNNWKNNDLNAIHNKTKTDEIMGINLVRVMQNICEEKFKTPLRDISKY